MKLIDDRNFYTKKVRILNKKLRKIDIAIKQMEAIE